MKVSDFDYELPQDRIAQEPCGRRDRSRLMVVPAGPEPIFHGVFRQLPELLREGDLLVVNDTRVIPARLHGAKATGGRVELLLLEPLSPDDKDPCWSCLIRASRNPRPGEMLRFGSGLRAVVLDRRDEEWTVRLEHPSGRPWDVVEQVGVMPLPPYIRREIEDPRATMDRERYQTVYSRRPGAVAAPTAGLHFTPAMLDEIETRGVGVAPITLHVGSGTFRPVRVERVEDHVMHAETFDVPESSADAIADARRRGGRIVAVGTTVVRTLEATAGENGVPAAGPGRCDLFIYPGYRFRAVDAMITNFHLPRSSLLMLVSAFAGRQRILDAYRLAVEEGYRFYSYGDAMLLFPAAGRMRAEG